MTEKLESLREKIDDIDSRLLKLLSARARIVQRVAEAKNGAAVYRPEREAQVLRRVAQENPGPLPDRAVQRVFTEIMDDPAQVAAIARGLDVVFTQGVIVLEGRDVTDAIRAEAVGVAASQVAALPPVRAALLGRQRAFRQPPGLVADGRDMGSVVFPDAGLKIFLTAAAEERARRRYNQLMEKGMNASMSALLQEIRERDDRDSRRAAAPLQKCSDAIELDTTHMTVDEAVAQVLTLYHSKAAPKAP